MMNYAIKIEVEIHARYPDAREATIDADDIAEQLREELREECGNIVDSVRVADVQATGDSREE